MYCVKCGKENDDANVFCVGCGANLKENDVKTYKAVSYNKAEGKNIVFSETTYGDYKMLNFTCALNNIGVGKDGKTDYTKYDTNYYVRAYIVFENAEGDTKTVHTEKDDYEASAIIFAVGAHHAKLGVKGEEELTGMGVSYCATCDGAFFKNRKVAVVGGGDVAIEDAIFLARGCEKVYVIHRRDTFRAAHSLVERARQMDNIEFIIDTTVSEICGEDMVEKLMLTNVKTKEKTELEVDGIFIAVGIVPDTDIFQGIVAMDEKGYVLADAFGNTDIPGIFVAGEIK